jgi:hypothetical protein
MNEAVGHGDELGPLIKVLRQAMEETRVPLDRERSERIFRGVMAELERRRQSWPRRLMHSMQMRWHHLRSTLAALPRRPSHGT